MDNRMTEDFLWFSYFGITKSDAKKDTTAALKACIIRAYHDVCRRIDYSKSDTDLKKLPKSERAAYNNLKRSFLSTDCVKCESVICLISNHIYSLINEAACNMDAFNLWHETTCNCIISFANGYASEKFRLLSNDSFKYGLAQKWINLSLKNMMVMGLWSKLEGFEPFLHVTIDSYIYKAAADQSSNNCFALHKPIAPKKHQDEDEGNLDFYFAEEKKEKAQTQPWSNLNKADYIQLQANIRKILQSTQFEKLGTLYPFDWEWYAWMAQAKLEK